MDGHDKRLRFARGGKKARSESLPAASVRPASLKSGMETVRVRPPRARPTRADAADLQGAAERAQEPRTEHGRA